MENINKEEWADKFYKYGIIQKIGNEAFLSGFRQYVDQIFNSDNSNEFVLAISFCHKSAETMTRIIIEYMELYENAGNYPDIKDNPSLVGLSLDDLIRIVEKNDQFKGINSFVSNAKELNSISSDYIYNLLCIKGWKFTLEEKKQDLSRIYGSLFDSFLEFYKDYIKHYSDLKNRVLGKDFKLSG